MTTHKQLAMLAFGLFAMTCMAIPEVSNVTMTQDASRKVTITYSLSNGPAIVTVDICTNGVSIGSGNLHFLSGDVNSKVVGDGVHTIYWQADRSWPDHKVVNAEATAVVTAWSLDTPPDYMVVNLLAKGDVAFYVDAAALPGGLLDDPIYRTTKLVMRKIPAKGVAWTMGSPVGETGRQDEREDLHSVTLDADYYIGVFPVTVSQYKKFFPNYTPWFYTDSELRPAERLAWDVLKASEGLLALLSAHVGIVDFDLPAEAQWEFACRGPDVGRVAGRWNDGSTILGTDQDANLDGLACYRRAGDRADAPDVGGTRLVGSGRSNGYGLYDMHGGVREWCLDTYLKNITELNGAVCTTGSGRVERGGAWNQDAKHCRSAARHYAESSSNSGEFGVRLASPASVK